MKKRNWRSQKENLHPGHRRTDTLISRQWIEAVVINKYPTNALFVMTLLDPSRSGRCCSITSYVGVHYRCCVWQDKDFTTTSHPWALMFIRTVTSFEYFVLTLINDCLVHSTAQPSALPTSISMQKPSSVFVTKSLFMEINTTFIFVMVLLVFQWLPTSHLCFFPLQLALDGHWTVFVG